MQKNLIEKNLSLITYFSGKRKLECTIFAESMDLLTLLFACLCHWYSRRRYQHMLFHSTNLGSRYQVSSKVNKILPDNTHYFFVIHALVLSAPIIDF